MNGQDEIDQHIEGLERLSTDELVKRVLRLEEKLDEIREAARDAISGERGKWKRDELWGQLEEIHAMSSYANLAS